MADKALVLHGVLAIVVIAGYIVLTSLGNDGSALLGVLGGQALGGGIQASTNGANHV